MADYPFPNVIRLSIGSHSGSNLDSEMLSLLVFNLQFMMCHDSATKYNVYRLETALAFCGKFEGNSKLICPVYCQNISETGNVKRYMQFQR